MNKLWLIIKREYWVRVRKKSFLIITLLAPLAYGLMMFGIAFFTAHFMDKVTNRILVKDDSGIFQNYQSKKKDGIYDFSNKNPDSLKNTYKKNKYDILVYIPQFTDKNNTVEVKYYTYKKPGLSALAKIEKDISKAFKQYKVEKSGIDKKIFESLNVEVNLEKAEESGSKDKTGKISIAISTALAFGMGFLLYTVIFIFGAQVMRSVMEEKINRIVEIIISSVKPFQLMMGKVIGVGAVGLTQLLIWIILIQLIMAGVAIFVGHIPQGTPEAINGIQSQMNTEAIEGISLSVILNEFFSLNWWLILPSFIMFFLGGYFLYSSLFAAVGASIGDDMGESQSLVWPISMPVIFAFIIMFNSINNPDSSLAVFGSMFPLFSPIVMPARLPFDPPLWQVLLSLFLLIITTLFFIWLSAKIYRTNILMYGKKISFKEIFKIIKS